MTAMKIIVVISLDSPNRLMPQLVIDLLLLSAAAVVLGGASAALLLLFADEVVVVLDMRAAVVIATVAVDAKFWLVAIWRLSNSQASVGTIRIRVTQQ